MKSMSKGNILLLAILLFSARPHRNLDGGSMEFRRRC